MYVSSSCVFKFFKKLVLKHLNRTLYVLCGAVLGVCVYMCVCMCVYVCRCVYVCV
jgi:hypothetical protein